MGEDILVQTSDNGRNLIKRFEGLRLKAYRDSVGKLTIGWGHTANVKEDDVITQDQAEDFLTSDIGRCERCIKGNGHDGLLWGVNLNQNQFDALVSWIFNFGCGNFATSMIFKRLKNLDYEGAGKAWIDPDLIWNKAKGKVLPGLTLRRQAEHALFITPTENL